MRILVTGASGFIGRHVLEEASSRGHEVLPLLRKGSDRSGLERWLPAAREGDLRDEASLERAVAGADAVVHLGGLTRARSLAEFLSVNEEGVARLARATAKAGGVRRLVLVSSLASAGPGTVERPRDEEAPPEPRTPYGLSKLRGEAALRDNAGSVPWTIVRPPIVYGPWERDIFTIFKLARRGVVPVVGWRDRHYSVVYGPDLARALVLAAETDSAAGQILHVAEPQPYSYASLVGAIGTALGRRVRILRLPELAAHLVALGGSVAGPFLRRPALVSRAKLPEILAPGWVSATAKTARLLPGLRFTPFAEGAAATAAWYLREGWLR